MKRKFAELLNVIFGFRKFILMLFVILVAIIFRCLNLVNGSEMVDLLKATTIAFFGANGIEHVMTVVKTSMDAKSGVTAAALAAQENGVADTDESNDEEDVEVK
jgi:hypothetical protein